MNKQKLIDAVLEQIKIDVNNSDLTAIEELLKNVDNLFLFGYLPENVKELIDE